MIETKLTVQHKTHSSTDSRLEALANQQGVRPLQDIQQLREDSWTDDENEESFVQTVSNWRKEKNNWKLQ